MRWCRDGAVAMVRAAGMAEAMVRAAGMAVAMARAAVAMARAVCTWRRQAEVGGGGVQQPRAPRAVAAYLRLSRRISAHLGVSRASSLVSKPTSRPLSGWTTGKPP